MGFDPRSRAGSDSTTGRRGRSPKVSIHAPVRGATSRSSLPTSALQFRSTLPCGERPCKSARHGAETGFDPRSRAGSDAGRQDPLRRPRVSIHAPVRGATVDLAADAQKRCVSIHAPVRGATQSPARTRRLCMVSIHAPVRGATPDAGREPRLSRVSIHAPVRGATWLEGQDRPEGPVSIHAPVRGAT